MSEGDKAFAGSIPALYERHLVPLIFAPYADDLARRVAEGGPGDVLENAAGTGALTRVLAAALPPAARLVATDLNQAMLDEAASRLPPGRAVAWRQADMTALPFADAGFDAVACQFGVMFAPDKVAAFSEARRVLRPGGRFLFNVWDHIAANDFASCAQEALRARFPDDPPLFMTRTPHGYHDGDRIRRELGDAGFGEVAIEAMSHVSRAPSARDAATGLCQGTPWRGEIEARAPGGLAAVTEHVAAALARRFGSGPIVGDIRALVVTARKAA
jgi:SAM-dependent methyltransferase